MSSSSPLPASCPPWAHHVAGGWHYADLFCTVQLSQFESDLLVCHEPPGAAALRNSLKTRYNTLGNKSLHTTKTPLLYKLPMSQIYLASFVIFRLKSSWHWKIISIRAAHINDANKIQKRTILRSLLLCIMKPCYESVFICMNENEENYSAVMQVWNVSSEKLPTFSGWIWKTLQEATRGGGIDNHRKMWFMFRKINTRVCRKILLWSFFLLVASRSGVWECELFGVSEVGQARKRSTGLS